MIRQSKSDYQQLKDSIYWQHHKEHMKNQLASQGLYHLTDADYVVLNTELDKAQQEWLYLVFETSYKNPTAKKVVLVHIKDKATRAIWAELCNQLDNSELRSEQISMFLM